MAVIEPAVGGILPASVSSVLNAAINQAAVEGGAIVLYRNILAGDPAPPASLTAVSPGEALTVYRLGERLEAGDPGIPTGVPTGAIYFELIPGGDMTADYNPISGEFFVENVDQVAGYLVGRALRDPLAPFDATDNPYVGPSQVIQTLSGVSIDLPTVP